MNKTANYYESEEMMVDTGDLLSLIGNARYNGVDSVLIHSEHLSEDFFDLKTGVAGEYLQKMNYSMKAAIVLCESHLEHPRFREMVFEANRSGDIVYFQDSHSAQAWLNNN